MSIQKLPLPGKISLKRLIQLLPAQRSARDEYPFFFDGRDLDFADDRADFDARNAFVAAELCRLSYETAETVAGLLAERNYDVSVLHDPRQDGDMFIARRGATAFVVYRGTEFFGLRDWGIDGKFLLKRTGAARVHRGFYKQLLSLERNRAVGERLRRARTEGVRRFVFCGHSLGAALAQLAAFYYVSGGVLSGDEVRLITFGGPRVGDAAFARKCDARLPYFFRVVHDRDIVPRLPPFQSYVHAGTLARLSGDDSIALRPDFREERGLAALVRFLAGTIPGLRGIFRSFWDHLPVHYSIILWNLAARDANPHPN